MSCSATFVILYLAEQSYFYVSAAAYNFIKAADKTQNYIYPARYKYLVDYIALKYVIGYNMITLSQVDTLLPVCGLSSQEHQFLLKQSRLDAM